MNFTLIKTYCLLGIVFFTFFNAYSQNEFQIIETRINQYLKSDFDKNKLTQLIKTDLSSQVENGSWKEIDYASESETSWKPLLHLNRIKYFALGFSSPGNDFYGNQRLLKSTINGLRFWYAQNPKSSNWFQNDIATPTALGEILILLNGGKETLPVGLQDSLVIRMNKGDVKRAIGANKLDIATHMIYSACIAKNEELLAFAVAEAFKPIEFTSKEGLQFDYSYLQHQSQLQIASYGQVFLTGEYKVASWMLGTSYSVSADKLKILDSYLISTYLKTIRGQYIDFNTEGRGISRNDVLDKTSITKGNNSLLELAKLVNPANEKVLNAAIERITQQKAPSFEILPSHTQFWKGDYTLHVRPKYSFNVRTVSKRTFRTELGNRENLIGKFLPDGSTNIQRSGLEYFNIMPVWEWDKIPGITSRDYKENQLTTIEWGERGAGSFIGGVSDGVYGASVYSLDYNMVTAKKAWFYFDKQVVCLGADINSFATENVVTTINQSWQKGKIFAFADEKLSKVRHKKSFGKASWVWQDSIGYYFSNAGKLAEMKNNALTEIKILANNNAVQAVKNEDLNMIQAVFYEAGTLTDHGFSVTVDEPCVILLKNIDTKNPIIHLADPTQYLKEILITVNSSLIKGEKKIALSLPKGDFAGSTVNCIVN